MVDEVLREKLRKIKALADDGKNEAECQTALLMFQRLLAKNGLSEREVALDDLPDEKEEVTETSVFAGSKIPKWLRVLYITVAEHFRCAPVAERTMGFTSLLFIGHEKDAAIAAEAFFAAKSAAVRLSVDYEMECLINEAEKGIPYSFDRNNYLFGFAKGVDAAYRRQEAENCTGLIIVKPADVIEATRKYSTKAFRYGESNDHSTLAGFRDGESVGRGNALQNGGNRCATPPEV
jgi:hypothetical protein